MTKRDFLIYLAGPYSPYKDDLGHHHTTAGNISKAKEMACTLWQMGFTVLAPHLNTADFENFCSCNYEDYLAGDFTILKRCDAVLFLPDWQKSTGSIREYNFSKQNNIPIYFKIEDLPQ